MPPSTAKYRSTRPNVASPETNVIEISVDSEEETEEDQEEAVGEENEEEVGRFDDAVLSNEGESDKGSETQGPEETGESGGSDEGSADVVCLPGVTRGISRLQHYRTMPIIIVLW